MRKGKKLKLKAKPKSTTNPRRKKATRIALFVLFGLVALLIGWGVLLKRTANKEVVYVYIPTNASYSKVIKELAKEKVLKHDIAFSLIARVLNYPSNVRSGKYKVSPKLNYISLILQLKSGKQEPVNLVFNNIQSKEKFASVISKQLEIDSIQIIEVLNDEENFMKSYGLSKEEVLLLFIPNTYQIFWNTSQKDFFDRMHHEYKSFWNAERMAKAEKIGLTPQQVGILASIVQKETAKNDEKPRVAGVYANRLKKQMALQADPTLIFALNDYTIKRVTGKHFNIDSPYNTYKYRGLPPGPICLPEISSIDAVLSYENHDYIYFCAKEDFSGYHNFAANYRDHINNAKRYQKALNNRKIFN